MTVAGHTDAEPILRESVTLYQAQPTGWLLFHTQSLLGVTRRSAEIRRRGAAIDRELPGIARPSEEIPPNRRGVLINAADRLCELYTAWKRPDEAVKWRAERAKYGRKRAPPRAKR